MVEQLESRTLFSYPAGPYWHPFEDNPRGTLVHQYEISQPATYTATGVGAAWGSDPRAFLPSGGATLSLTNVPAHSEIKVIAEIGELRVDSQQGNDATPDGGCIRLNGVEVASASYVPDEGADINTGYRPNAGDAVTVNVGPTRLEPGEEALLWNVAVYIWTPEITLAHPPSLGEGERGIVLVTRTMGDHGLFPIPVRLAKVEVFGVNQASNADWTLQTSVDIPPGPPGTSVRAQITVVDDTAHEPQETANYRVLPSNIHKEGGTPEQPTGNRSFWINPSDYNPYGGGYPSQGSSSNDLIAPEYHDDSVGALVDSVAGELVGEIIT